MKSSAHGLLFVYFTPLVFCMLPEFVSTVCLEVLFAWNIKKENLWSGWVCEESLWNLAKLKQKMPKQNELIAYKIFDELTSEKCQTVQRT